MTQLNTLIEKATRGELLLLIGNDLPEKFTGVPPNQILAQKLAQQFNKPAEPSLAAITAKLTPAQYVPFIQHQLNQARTDESSTIYKAIASLPIPYLITATFDNQLAQALENAGIAFNLLAKNSDLDKRKFNRTDLVKLCGDNSRNIPLTLSKPQYISLLNRTDRKEIFNNQVNDWFQNKTVLMVGCNPAATGDNRSDFYWLYRHVLKFRSAFQKGGFLVWPNPDDVTFWTQPQRNVNIINEDPLLFLDQLAAGLVGKKIDLPADQELEGLKRLALVFTSKPSADQVTAVASTISPRQRIRQVRASLRLKLEAEPGKQLTLRSRLDMETFPDMQSLPPDEFRDTGITFDDLEEWAEDAAIQRTKGEAFDKSIVEKNGIAFFDKILPIDTQARRIFAHALYLEQNNADVFTIVLELDDTKRRISNFPWELLHAGQVNWEGVINGRGFLGRHYPVYRRLAGVTSAERVAARIQRILVVAADPTDKLTDALKTEVAWLRDIFPRDIHVDIIGPDDARVSRPDKIKELLRDGNYQLFHYTGHAQFNSDFPGESKLLLGQPEDQDEKKLSAAELGSIARQSPLTFVSLSACQGSQTAEEVEKERPWEELGIADALFDNGVPAVLGMRWNVGVDSALKMVKRFYLELLKGKPAEMALMLARGDVSADQPAWANPVLIKRHGVLDQGIYGSGG